MRIPHTNAVGHRRILVPVSVVPVLVPVPALAGSSETRIETQTSIPYEVFAAGFETDQ